MVDGTYIEQIRSQIQFRVDLYGDKQPEFISNTDMEFFIGKSIDDYWQDNSSWIEFELEQFNGSNFHLEPKVIFDTKYGYISSLKSTTTEQFAIRERRMILNILSDGRTGIYSGDIITYLNHVNKFITGSNFEEFLTSDAVQYLGDIITLSEGFSNKVNFGLLLHVLDELNMLGFDIEDYESINFSELFTAMASTFGNIGSRQNLKKSVESGFERNREGVISLTKSISEVAK